MAGWLAALTTAGSLAAGSLARGRAGDGLAPSRLWHCYHDPSLGTPAARALLACRPWRRWGMPPARPCSFLPVTSDGDELVTRWVSVCMYGWVWVRLADETESVRRVAEVARLSVAWKWGRRRLFVGAAGGGVTVGLQMPDARHSPVRPGPDTFWKICLRYRGFPQPRAPPSGPAPQRSASYRLLSQHSLSPLRPCSPHRRRVAPAGLSAARRHAARSCV